MSVVGESGSGKSTLGNAVLGLVPPTAGRIAFAGEDITHASARRRRALTADIQAVFQDPFGSLNPVAESADPEEPLRPTRRSPKPSAATGSPRSSPWSASTRTPPAATRAVLRRPVAARRHRPRTRALPRLLICDEAVSALDLSIQAQVLNLLTTLQRELGLAYLFITHDLAVVRHLSNRVVVLYRGRVMETGTVNEVCEHPRHPYTRALLAAAPVPDPVEQRARRLASPAPRDAPAPPAEPGCPFRHRCPHVAQVCATDPPPHTAGTGIVACHRYEELNPTGTATAPNDTDQRRTTTR